MNKRILIIGNNDGLPGVKVDIENYKRFFKSSFGGEWNDNEIIEKLNVSKSNLQTQLDLLKKMQLNYLIIIFSGHGGQERETLLELNSSGELISENELKNLAYRQLNIYDCCRTYTPLVAESVVNLLKAKLFSTTSTRLKYEQRIMEAAHQQVYLYACSEGECAHDTKEGGAYSKHLINSARTVDTEFKTVGNAHEQATLLTSREFNDQNPEAILPRILTSQQLIIAIKP